MSCISASRGFPASTWLHRPRLTDIFCRALRLAYVWRLVSSANNPCYSPCIYGHLRKACLHTVCLSRVRRDYFTPMMTSSHPQSIHISPELWGEPMSPGGFGDPPQLSSKPSVVLEERLAISSSDHCDTRNLSTPTNCRCMRGG